MVMQSPTPSPEAQVHKPWEQAPNGYQPWYPYRPPPQVRATTLPRRPHRAARPWRARELAAALAAVIVVDVACWSGGPVLGGLGGALLLLCTAIAIVVGARQRRTSSHLVVVGVLVGLTALRSAIAPTVTLALGAPFLLLALALALRTRRLLTTTLLHSAVSALVALPARIGASSRGLTRLVPRLRVAPASVLVPLGLVLVFLGVFALANPVVAHGLHAATTWLGSIVALPPVGRVVLWVFAAFAALIAVRPVLVLPRGVETAAPALEAPPASITIARNALVALTVLFLAYEAVDIRYLWTGAPPAGMTTQEYAHQGAFWLTVALLLLTVVVGVMFRGPLAGDPRAALVRKLAYVWIGEGAFLGLCTYRRIAMHVAKSGLSDLRIVGILGTSLVLFGLVLVVWKLRADKTFLWLVRRQLDAFAIVAVVYVLSPTHWLGAQVNVGRVAAGEYRPLLHAFRQARETESVAVWLPLLEHPDQRVREGIAALVKDEEETLRTRTELATHWQSRDLASGVALARIEAALPRVDAILKDVSREGARDVLFKISRSANQDATLEEILAIPGASHSNAREGEY